MYYFISLILWVTAIKKHNLYHSQEYKILYNMAKSSLGPINNTFYKCVKPSVLESLFNNKGMVFWYYSYVNLNSLQITIHIVLQIDFICRSVCLLGLFWTEIRVPLLFSHQQKQKMSKKCKSASMKKCRFLFEWVLW